MTPLPPLPALPRSVLNTLWAQIHEPFGAPRHDPLARLCALRNDVFAGVPGSFWGAGTPEAPQLVMGLQLEDGPWWADAAGMVWPSWDAWATRQASTPRRLADSQSVGEWLGQGHTPTDWPQRLQPSRFDWDHVGIGLMLSRPLSSPPVNEEALVEDLWGFSCHPYFGRSIAQDLNAVGHRCTTVQAQFYHAHHQALHQVLAAHGVALRQTWPMPQDGPKPVPEDALHVKAPKVRF